MEASQEFANVCAPHSGPLPCALRGCFAASGRAHVCVGVCRCVSALTSLPNITKQLTNEGNEPYHGSDPITGCNPLAQFPNIGVFLQENILLVY